MTDPLVRLELSELLELLASESTSFASGALAATTLAGAAAMIGMAARRSPGWEEAQGVAGQADVMRRRAVDLIEESAAAYDAAVRRLGGVGGPEGSEEQRNWELGQALHRAAVAPLRVAEVGADVAVLGSTCAGACDASVRPDAVSAILLARAVVEVGVTLFRANLASGSDKAMASHAEQLDAAAARAVSDVSG
jgi:formiminotetrahydrofolate cyclodeaminase